MEKKTQQIQQNKIEIEGLSITDPQLLALFQMLHEKKEQAEVVKACVFFERGNDYTINVKFNGEKLASFYFTNHDEVVHAYTMLSETLEQYKARRVLEGDTQAIMKYLND